MGRKRRQRICSAFLEDLPNELFAQIFSYLKGVDAIHAFSSLNHRFQCLLMENCQSFNFESINKSDFDFIFRHCHTKRWKSISISNSEHTPGQVEYFCESNSLMNDFPQLQSLSVLNLDRQKTYRLFSQRPSLSNLVSLTIKSVCGEKMPQLNLPNLKRLVVRACLNIDWIKNCSHLESIEYAVDTCHRYKDDLSWPSTLRHLQVSLNFEGCWASIQRSLIHLPLLNTLEIYQKERISQCPNGRIWEHAIRSSLPLLKIFKFYFNIEYSSSNPRQIDDIIASYSTPFYVLENKWFIRCDISQRGGHALLYSLPFPFGTYTALRGNNIKSISTRLDDFDSNTFANVHTLEVFYKTSEPDKNFDKNAVINLIIYNDFNAIKWMHVLNKLQYLEMNCPITMSSQNFLYILKNAPYLHSIVTEKRVLQIATDHWNNVSICDHLSRKIISLNLCGKYGQSQQHMSNREIQHLIQIFSSKCQHLSLCIQSPDDTIGFILENMSQLQSLHISISGKLYPVIDMTWLEKQQNKFNNSNCLMMIDERHHYFWLGKGQS